MGQLLERSRVRHLLCSGGARAIRESAGASQQEFADELGVDVATIGRWESGQRSPRGELADRYGQLLDVLSALAALESREPS